MSSEEAPSAAKKLKASPSSASWRQKCIDTFQLQPVPEAWKSKVAPGSEAGWERYYNYRIKQNDNACLSNILCKEEHKTDGFVDYLDVDEYDLYYEDEDGNDADEDQHVEDSTKEDMLVMSMWKNQMKSKVESHQESKALHCPWKWTPSLSIVWEDENNLREAIYYSHVWSPYAIPHAVIVRHEFYRKVGWSEATSTFFLDYHYALKDLEDEPESSGSGSNELRELCSYPKTMDGMKIGLINDMRKFLYGDVGQKCKDATCSDVIFLELLFGSMGSTSYHSDAASGCELGYYWMPSEDEAKKLRSEGVPASDDKEGPPKEKERYHSIRWLEYQVKRVTNTLGPYSKHYKYIPPRSSNNDYSDDEDYDDYSY